MKKIREQEPIEKRPVGRPKIQLSDLPDNWEDIIIELASIGASDVEIRSKLNCICHETWTRLIGEEPKFSETVKKACILCEAWWQEQGRTNLINTYQGDNLNPVLWYMNMKNRFGWADKQEVKHSGDIKIETVNYGDKD